MAAPITTVILTDSETDTRGSPTSPLSQAAQGIFTSGSETRVEGHSNGWLSEDDDEDPIEDVPVLPEAPAPAIIEIVAPAPVVEETVAPLVILSPPRRDRDMTIVYTRRRKRTRVTSTVDASDDPAHPAPEGDREPKRARVVSQSEHGESSRAPMDRAAAQFAPILTARVAEVEQQHTTLRQEFQHMTLMSESLDGRLMTIEDERYLDHDALMQMHFRVVDLEQGQTDLRQEAEALRLRAEAAEASAVAAQHQAAMATSRADAALAAVDYCLAAMSYATGFPMIPYFFP
jgi:hypothetical protein